MPALISTPISIARIGSMLRPKPGTAPRRVRHVAAQVQDAADEVDGAEDGRPQRADVMAEEPDGREKRDQQLERVLLHAEIALEHLVAGDGRRLHAVLAAGLAHQHGETDVLQQREHEDDATSSMGASSPGDPVWV